MPPVSPLRYMLPDPALRPLISTYYVGAFAAGQPAVEDLLPPEWGNVRFPLSGALSVAVAGVRHGGEPLLFGPTSRASLVRVEPPAVGVGVGLLPLGWVQLIGQPAADYADRAVRLTDVLGAGVLALFQALRAAPEAALAGLLDAYFLSRSASRPPLSPLVVRAHEVLLDPTVGTAEGFAAALGVSARHARRLSMQLFGFAPKLLLQRQRFLRTLAGIRLHPGTPWAEQLDGWYVDQSHFVRDFRRFMGSSPTAYFNGMGAILAAAAEIRTAVAGQPLQGLHPPAA